MERIIPYFLGEPKYKFLKLNEFLKCLAKALATVSGDVLIFIYLKMLYREFLTSISVLV